ncbi:MAG: hypothetical protein ABR555_18280 [Pyrinomonadaceae bacterium]
MADLPDYEIFKSELNGKFRIHVEGHGPVELTMTELSELRSSGRNESFAVHFLGPKEYVLPQRTYSFQNENLGDLDLMIVPIKQTNDGVYYEAIFNRLL